MQEDGKFEPAIVTDTANTISLINGISGLELGTGTDNSLTVAGLAITYYNSKGGITGDELTEEELNIINSLANTEEFNISEQKQIAGLYLSGAMENVEIEDVKHNLTKEETVLIADLLT